MDCIEPRPKIDDNLTDAMLLHCRYLDQVHKFPHVGKFMHLIRIYALGQWLFYTPFQCTLPRTFTYQACPFSVHCLSFNALPAEIRTRNHGISTVLMFLRINLITNWGKFCTCCCLGENFALVPDILMLYVFIL